MDLIYSESPCSEVSGLSEPSHVVFQQASLQLHYKKNTKANVSK